MWSTLKDWFVEMAVRLWGYYKSLPVARPTTSASPEHPLEEKKTEVIDAIEGSELWKAKNETP
jgi:hypothetical protein